MISFEFHLEKWHEKTLETVAALGFSGPISFSVLLVGIPTARGYNAPCFEGMVHNFVGSILMRWDNEDRKDILSIVLAIQNETKHFQVVSSNFQVQY
jgi:hypothetical protein